MRARVLLCRFAERDFDEECLFSERCLVFFEFFKFCLSSLFLLAGNGSAAQTHENTTRVDQNQNPSFRVSTIALFF